MSVLDDARTYLRDQDLIDGDTDWPSSKRFEHDEDGNQLVILGEDGGPAPEMAADSGIGDSALGDAGLQIRVRGNPHKGDSTKAKAQEIRDALHGLRNVTIGGTLYYRIRSMTKEPVLVGYDEDRRPSHSVSFRFLTDS